MDGEPLNETVDETKKNEDRRKKRASWEKEERPDSNYRRLHILSYRCTNTWKKSPGPHFGTVLSNLTIIYKSFLALHMPYWFRF